MQLGFYMQTEMSFDESPLRWGKDETLGKQIYMKLKGRNCQTLDNKQGFKTRIIKFRGDVPKAQNEGDYKL